MKSNDEFHNDFTGYNINSLESTPEVIKLKYIESYGGIYNYIDSVKFNAEALGLLEKYLNYKISEVSNSSQQNIFHTLRSMILNSSSKEYSTIRNLR